MTTKTPSLSRLAWVDHLKGLCILGILLFHFFQSYPPELSLINFLERQFAKVGFAAVDIFFVIAGFMTTYSFLKKKIQQDIPLSKINFRSWFGSRLLRIYPGYFLAVVCSLILFYRFENFPKLGWNLVSFLSIMGWGGIMFQIINPGFWFFTALLQAYLLTPLILKFSQHKPITILWIGIIGGAIVKLLAIFLLLTNLSTTYPYLYGFFYQNNFIGSYWFQLCLGLYWGYIFCEMKSCRAVDYKNSLIAFLIGIVFFIFLPLQGLEIPYKLGVDMLLTPLMFLGLYGILSYLDRIAVWQTILKLLTVLGQYSYQIYLIHQPLYYISLGTLAGSLAVNVFLKPWVVLAIVWAILALYVFLFICLDNWLKKIIVLPKNAKINF